MKFQWLKGGFLAGKRTYIIGWVMVVSGAAGWATGEISVGAALDQVLQGAAFIAIRSGMAAEAAKRGG